MHAPQRDLWYGTRGPQNARIVLIGESWGAEEALHKIPFVGVSGRELERMLQEAGIPPSTILFTNVIAERPYANETFRFFEPKNSSQSKRVGGLLPNSLAKSELRRLYNQLAASPRDLVIAAGNWSLWAVSQSTGAEVVREANGRRVPEDIQTWTPNGIMNWRGSMLYCRGHEEFGPLRDYRLLPIIHPAAIQRAWYYRSPTVHDLRTRVPMALRGDWRMSPPPVTLSPPDYGEAIGTLRGWLQRASKEEFDLVSDIETTQRRFISVVGFSDSVSFAMAIPFLRPTPGGLEDYWTVDQEAQIVALIRQVLHHPNIKVIGQNYIYDTQYIQHWFGIMPHLDFDTMLAQNVLFPGTPKDLSYLSSLYCQYHWYWKDDVKDWER